MRAQVKVAAPAGMLAGIIVGVSEAARAAAADRALTGAGEFWAAWAITVGIYAALGLIAFGALGILGALVAGSRRRGAAAPSPVFYAAVAAAAVPAVMMVGQADLSTPEVVRGILLPRVAGACALAAALAGAAVKVLGRRVRLDSGDAAAFAAGCLVGGALWARWAGSASAAAAAAALGLVAALTLDGLWRVWRRARGSQAGEKALWRLVAAEPVVLVILGGLAVARVAFPSPPRAAPSVLLITVDALRADRLGAYGSRRGLTPNLDEFARDAVVFENAFTQAPWTIPSIGSLFVSRYPSELGVVARERTAQEALIRGGLLTAQPTLAELLRAAGFSTAAEVPNPQLRRVRSVQRGFLVFRNPCDFQGESLPSLPRLGAYEGWFLHTSVGLRLAQALYRPPRYYRAPGLRPDDAQRVVRDASSWLARQRRPFFLWMHLMDTHVPYRPRPHVAQQPSAVDMAAGKPLSPTAEFFKNLVWQRISLTARQKRYVTALYDANVRHADQWIGRLCNRLRELNRYRDTLIIITADHGEELWDHGGFEHGRTLYDEVLQVPLIVKFPGSRWARQRVSAQVGLMDVLPTVMEVARLPIPHGVRGESLLRLLRPQAAHRPPRRGRVRPRALFAEFTLYGEELKGLRTARYKVIFHRSRPATREFEVYDLRVDPQERHDLAGDGRVAAGLRRRLLELARASEQRARTWGARAGGKAAPLDERTAEALRSIGYMAP